MFGEDQGRYLLTLPHSEDQKVLDLAMAAGVSCRYVGRIGGDTICVGDMPGASGNFADIPLADLRAAHEGFLPRLMGADGALA